MPDAVETMMYTKREVPWHGLGVAVEDTQTAKQALVAAELDWEVQLTEVFAQSNGKQLQVPDTYAVIRDKDESILGTVGSRYKPVQNHEAFNFFDNVVDSGEAKYETAGSLDGGRRIFLTAKVPKEIKVAGEDEVDLYLMMATSHDGSLSFTAAVTPVRVVCQNTLNVALKGAKQKWAMRHTDSIDGKIAEARQALDLTFKYSDQFEAEMNKLAATEFSKRDFEQMVQKVFPKSKESVTPFDERQYGLIGVFESSPTIPDGLRYTEWGALNAVAEFMDWGRSFRSSKSRSEAEQRTQATWFGPNVKARDDALAYIQSR